MFLPMKASGDRSPWGDFWFEPVSARALSGMRVGPDQAMRLAAVYACVSILAKCFAVPSFGLWRPRAGGGRDPANDHWLYRLIAKRPNKWQNPFEWRQMLMGHLALRGNSYCRIIGNPRGEVTDLIPLHPDRIRTEVLDDDGTYRYRRRLKDGTEEILAPGEVWHWRWLSLDGIVGVNPIEYQRETVGIGLAAQDYGARFFQNDGRPGGWIEHPGTFKDKTTRDNFRESWQGAQAGANRHKTAVLEAGMKFHEMEVKNNDAQFLETRQFSVTEVCRIFGVPPHLVGDLERATFANIEQQSLEFVTYTLTPYAESAEASIEYSLLGDDEGLDPEFDLSRFLRGDQAARSTFYKGLFGVGALSPNDIRIREGENPVEGGDNRFVPVNMQVLQENMPPPGAGAANNPGPGDDQPGSSNDPADAKQSRLETIALAAAERAARKEVAMVSALVGSKNLRADMEQAYAKYSGFLAQVLQIPERLAAEHCRQQMASTAISTRLDDFEALTLSRLERLALGGDPFEQES
jgi:HK97 family phage portal protein